MATAASSGSSLQPANAIDFLTLLHNLKAWLHRSASPFLKQRICFPDVVLGYVPTTNTCPAAEQSTKRTGWVKRGVHQPESIADHMYRMSMMGLICGADAATTTRSINH